MRRSNVRCTERGFTLVEVLIALTLTVVMTGLLFSSLHTYAKSGSVAREHLAEKDRARGIQQFVRTQLREIVPLSVRERRTLKGLFYGDETTIIYVSHIPSHRSAGGLHRNALFVEDADGAATLSFGYERLQPDKDGKYDDFADNLPAETRVLVESARSITFDFFGRPEPDDDAAWHARWEGSAQLPELVRIRIERSNSTIPETIVTRIYSPAPTNHIALTLGGQRRLRQRDTNDPGEHDGALGTGIEPGDTPVVKEQ